MFKKLKSVFVIEEESKQSKSTTSTTKAATTTKGKSAKSPAANKKLASASSQPSASAKPENKFVDMLLRSIEANNIEGFDYLEYKQSLQSLTKIESDEAKRYQNAYAMAQTMGLTKKKLSESIKRYLQILDGEEKKFTEAFEKQKSTQVIQREQNVANLKQSINAKQQQIKKLQAEIKEAEAELSKTEGKINESLAKVEATKEGFYASYQMVVGQIKADAEKIKQYLV
jgi:hypothetical protein